MRFRAMLTISMVWNKGRVYKESSGHTGSLKTRKRGNQSRLIFRKSTLKEQDLYWALAQDRVFIFINTRTDQFITHYNHSSEEKNSLAPDRI